MRRFKSDVHEAFGGKRYFDISLLRYFEECLPAVVGGMKRYSAFGVRPIKSKPLSVARGLLCYFEHQDAPIEVLVILLPAGEAGI